MMNIPAAFDSLPILQGWESVREIHRDSRSVIHQVRSATGAQAALKWIHLPPDPRGTDSRTLPEAQQLLEELSTMRSLASLPQITAIADSAVQIGADGSVDAFIRMELLTPVTKRLADRALTVEDAARVATDAARALRVCHSAGIIHGNIKPANILCTPGGFKLSDLGTGLSLLRLSRQQEDAPYFKAPEQRQGECATPLWDVYGLGMTLYTLFNGGLLPFQGKTGTEAEQAAWKRCCAIEGQSGASFPSPKHAPAGVAAVITKAIATQPEQRWPSVQALSDELNAAVAALSAAERRTALPYRGATGNSAPAKKNGGKGRGLVIALIILAVIAAIAIVPAALPKAPEPTATPTATPVPTPVPMTARVSAGATTAELTVNDLKADGQLTALICVTGAEKGYEVQFSGTAPTLTATLTQLAPATSYTVTVTGGGETAQASFTTLSAAATRFTPGTSRAFTLDSAWLTKHTANEMALDTNLISKLRLIRNELLTLTSQPLKEQKLALAASWSATMNGSFDDSEEAQNLLVLRAEQDVIAQAAPITQAAFDNLRYYHDFTPLMDAYYARYGTYPSGAVTLETYWLEELVGSISLTITVKDP